MSTNSENGTGLIVAALGGGALLLWLLWRGRGKAKGSGGDADHGSAPPAVEVRILSGDRIELDGVLSDLATMVARTRAAGVARVHATGDARAGWVTKVLETLRAARVDVGVDASISSRA